MFEYEILDPRTSFVMIDTDQFKQYNDHYGHGAGDERLARMARAINGCVQRAGDLLARYGGEEFAAILPGTPHEGALQLVQRLHDAVAELRIPHAHSSVAPRGTISVGIATTIANNDMSPDILSIAADRTLYPAKGAGRNTTRNTQV